MEGEREPAKATTEGQRADQYEGHTGGQHHPKPRRGGGKEIER